MSKTRRFQATTGSLRLVIGLSGGASSVRGAGEVLGELAAALCRHAQLGWHCCRALMGGATEATAIGFQELQPLTPHLMAVVVANQSGAELFWIE